MKIGYDKNYDTLNVVVQIIDDVLAKAVEQTEEGILSNNGEVIGELKEELIAKKLRKELGV